MFPINNGDLNHSHVIVYQRVRFSMANSLWFMKQQLGCSFQQWLGDVRRNHDWVAKCSMTYSLSLSRYCHPISEHGSFELCIGAEASDSRLIFIANWYELHKQRHVACAIFMRDIPHAFHLQFFFFFLNYPPVIKHGNGTYTIVITKTPTTSGCPIANYYPVGQRLQNDLV